MSFVYNYRSMIKKYHLV